MSKYILWIKYGTQNGNNPQPTKDWTLLDSFEKDDLDKLWSKQRELEKDNNQLMVTREVEIIADFAEEDVS